MVNNIIKLLIKLRFACLILCLLAITASCGKNNNNNDNTSLQEDTTAEKPISEETTTEATTAEDTAFNENNAAAGTAVLYSYTLQSSPGYYYASSVDPATDGNENTIPCAIYICENDDAYVSGSAGPLLLISDGSWHLFDALTGVATDVIINTDAEFSDMRPAYDINTDEITGYILISDKKTAFYSVVNGTVYGGFEYDSIDSRTCGDYFVAYKNTDTESYPGVDSYVLRISDGSLVGSVSSEQLTIAGNNDAVYFTSSFNPGCGGNMKVYTSDMKAISEEHFRMAEVASDGSLMTLGLDDRNTYAIYDRYGNRIYQSREYDDVLFIWSDGRSTDAAVVVDGGKLKLIDRSENVLQSYGGWRTGYYFHWLISGYRGGIPLSLYQEDYYLGYSVITNPGGEDPVYKDEKLPENKPSALYLIVEGNTDGSSREYFYVPGNGSAGVFDVAYVGAYSKPVLYLYPENDCDVSVAFGHPEKLTVTYPYYNDGWNVSVKADGTITDARGREYYALYWEESGFVPTDFSAGFCVKAENASEFLENKLAQIGLTEREANEFIIYWLPVMQNNGISLVYFELTASRERHNMLHITPQPDSLLRMAMHIKAVDAPVDIREQRLPHFEREGFAAVEWGGVIYK